jgi:hypothetical protein
MTVCLVTSLPEIPYIYTVYLWFWPTPFMQLGAGEVMQLGAGEGGCMFAALL